MLIICNTAVDVTLLAFVFIIKDFDQEVKGLQEENAPLPFFSYLVSLVFPGVLVTLVVPGDPRDHPCRPVRPFLCKGK